MENKFYSQFGEDKWLIENKIVPEKGFFLDLGAGHWQNLSNTYCFEEHGWEGICVDADIRQLSGLIEHRKNVVFGVIDTCGGLGNFYMNNDTPDISTTISARNEKQITMAHFDIKDLIVHFDIKKVDLLSIDIEGMECPVLLKMFDLNLFPEIIIVEYMTSGKDYSENIKQIMGKRYSLIHKTEANFIYKKV